MTPGYKAGWAAFQQYVLTVQAFGDEDALYDELPQLRRELERVRDHGIDYMTDFQEGWDDAADLAEDQDLSLA